MDCTLARLEFGSELARGKGRTGEHPSFFWSGPRSHHMALEPTLLAKAQDS